MNKYNLDLRNIPKELLHIINIINDKGIGDKKLLEDIDWECFTDLILHHRLYPYIYPVLSNIGGDIIPRVVLDKLKKYHTFNTFNMMYLSGEMEKLAKIFKSNDIRAIFLKGPFLGSFIYGDINLRTSSDIDVLIPLKDLEKVEAFLVKLGFQKDDYIKTILNDWKWRHHHITYSDPTNKVKIELHWRLNPGPSIEATFEELWERRQTCDLSRNYAYQLSIEDMFIFLVTHGARHGWSRLRWLLDIHYLASKQINWRDTKHLLEKYNNSHICGQALILSSNIFRTKLTQEQKKLLYKSNNSMKLAQGAVFYIERMVNLHNDPLPEEIAIYHKKHLFSLMSPKQKFMTVLSYLHPYPLDAELFPLPKHLHILYFPLRPLLWFLRKKVFQ